MESLQLQQLSKAAEKAWIALLRAAPPLFDRVEPALKAKGHPPVPWYDLLWKLAQAGEPLRQREQGDRLLVARYNLARLTDRPEGAGLIQREDCAEDARGQRLKLTPVGKALRAKMRP